MSLTLLTEHHFGFLSVKGGCRGLSESTHVKMLHRWHSHALAHICMEPLKIQSEKEVNIHLLNAHYCKMSVPRCLDNPIDSAVINLADEGMIYKN